MQDSATPRHLRAHPEGFTYHFGRNPDEVADCIPLQVTWMNKYKAPFFEEQIVSSHDLDPEVLRHWMRFNDLLLLPAMAQKRICWGVSTNYYDYASHLQGQGREVVNYLR